MYYIVKGAAPSPNKRKIKCRSYKHFDEKGFIEAEDIIHFDVAYVFDDVENIYWAHEILHTDVLYEHAPIKEKTPKTKHIPFINSNLRKTAFKKAMFFNNKKRTLANCGVYRMQRNLTTKLKRQSIRNYFSERCADGPKSNDCLPTVKPFLSNKRLLMYPLIILSGNRSNHTRPHLCCLFSDRVLCTCRLRQSNGRQ